MPFPSATACTPGGPRSQGEKVVSPRAARDAVRTDRMCFRWLRRVSWRLAHRRERAARRPFGVNGTRRRRPPAKQRVPFVRGCVPEVSGPSHETGRVRLLDQRQASTTASALRQPTGGDSSPPKVRAFGCFFPFHRTPGRGEAKQSGIHRERIPARQRTTTLRIYAACALTFVSTMPRQLRSSRLHRGFFRADRSSPLRIAPRTIAMPWRRCLFLQPHGNRFIPSGCGASRFHRRAPCPSILPQPSPLSLRAC